MNGGTCSVNKNNIASCSCINPWAGEICTIGADEASMIINDFNKSISGLASSTSKISNEDIKNINLYQSLIASYPNLIDTKTTLEMSKLAENQINLVAEGKAEANPNLLNILDFSLELTQ